MENELALAKLGTCVFKGASGDITEIRYIETTYFAFYKYSGWRAITDRLARQAVESKRQFHPNLPTHLTRPY